MTRTGELATEHTDYPRVYGESKYMVNDGVTRAYFARWSSALRYLRWTETLSRTRFAISGTHGPVAGLYNV